VDGEAATNDVGAPGETDDTAFNWARCGNCVTSCLYFTYFAVSAIVISIILALDWNLPCDVPLQTWFLTHLGILTGGFLMRLWTSINFCYRINESTSFVVAIPRFVTSLFEYCHVSLVRCRNGVDI